MCTVARCKRTFLSFSILVVSTRLVAQLRDPHLPQTACAALATEDPRPELLLMKPAGRTESLISKKMWKHILVQGFYQMFWLFLILCAASAPHTLPAHAPKLTPTCSLLTSCALILQVWSSTVLQRVQPAVSRLNGSKFPLICWCHGVPSAGWHKSDRHSDVRSA